MNAVYAVAVAVLVAIGVYQLLGKDLLRIAFGIYLLFNAVNVLIMAVGSAMVRGGKAPYTTLGPPYADPLVQAMVLTSIVIGFGLATFLLLLAARLGQRSGSLDVEEVCEWRH